VSGNGYGAGIGVTDYSPEAGGKPTVPSPTTTARSAIGGNAANLQSILDLVGQVNAFQQQQTYAGIPNYTGMAAQSSANISDQLAGRLPTDVRNQIWQASAERGVASGNPASSSAGYLKNLGLTSLNLTGAGETALTGAVARGTRAPLLDPSSFFVSPAQEQDAQLSGNIYASAPVPSAARSAAMSAANRGLQTGFNGARAPASRGGGDNTAALIDSILSQYAPQTASYYPGDIGAYGAGIDSGSGGANAGWLYPPSYTEPGEWMSTDATANEFAPPEMYGPPEAQDPGLFPDYYGGY
jgi:hypothetical protein